MTFDSFTRIIWVQEVSQWFKLHPIRSALFFNTGGATFDLGSVTANSAGDGISIEYSHNNQTLSLDISLGLSSISNTDELLSAIEII